MIKVKIHIGSQDDLQDWMMKLRTLIPMAVSVEIVAPNGLTMNLEEIINHEHEKNQKVNGNLPS